MANVPGNRERGFSLFELAVSAIVFAVLATILLVRIGQYYGEAERHSVQQTVAVLRTALDMRVARSGRAVRPAELARIAAENPFDWLQQKPDNYLGEYYSPERESIPTGNWVFDRRDKTLVYLPGGHRSFTFDTAKFLKFKVEFAQARVMTGNKNGPKDVPSGLVIVQVSDQAAIDIDTK